MLAYLGKNFGEHFSDNNIEIGDLINEIEL